MSYATASRQALAKKKQALLVTGDPDLSRFPRKSRCIGLMVIAEGHKNYPAAPANAIVLSALYLITFFMETDGAEVLSSLDE